MTHNLAGAMSLFTAGAELASRLIQQVALWALATSHDGNHIARTHRPGHPPLFRPDRIRELLASGRVAVNFALAMGLTCGGLFAQMRHVSLSAPVLRRLPRCPIPIGTE